MYLAAVFVSHGYANCLSCCCCLRLHIDFRIYFALSAAFHYFSLMISIRGEREQDSGPANPTIFVFVCLSVLVCVCVLVPACSAAFMRILLLAIFLFLLSYLCSVFPGKARKMIASKVPGQKVSSEQRSSSTWSQSRVQRSFHCLPFPAPCSISTSHSASPVQGFVLWLLLRVWPAAACANLSTAANIYTRITPPQPILLRPPPIFPSPPPPAPFNHASGWLLYWVCAPANCIRHLAQAAAASDGKL